MSAEIYSPISQGLILPSISESHSVSSAIARSAVTTRDFNRFGSSVESIRFIKTLDSNSANSIHTIKRRFSDKNDRTNLTFLCSQMISAY